MALDRQRMPPPMPPIEPADGHPDAMQVRVKLTSGEVRTRRFLLQEALSESITAFVHYAEQHREAVQIGVRDGYRIRWLDLDQSLQAQGVLPMDILLCRRR